MKKLQHILEYILIRFWLMFISILPLKYGTYLTAEIFQFIGRRLQASKTAKQNLQKILPQYHDNQVDDIINQVWSNLGHVVSETPYLVGLPQDEFDKYVSLKGEENLKPVMNKKVLFCSAHLANWEIIGRSVAPFIPRINAVYRASNNKLVDNLINQLRSEHVQGSLIPKGKLGAKLIVKALQNNEAVCILADQRMDNGIKIPFLGHNAMTAPAIATLSIKYDCPIIPIQVIRKADSHFEVIVHPVIKHQGKNVEEIMNEINLTIGKWVKENPGQWFWLHRRWGK